MNNLTGTDRKYWGIFVVIAVMTSGYLLFFASFVVEEQEARFSSIASVALQQQRDIENLERRVEVIENVESETIGNLNEKETMQVTVKTTMGTFTLELFDAKAPKTVENFVKLAKENFYDGIKFHRVIQGFMIQGGDPLTKDDAQKAYWGTGGPGYQFEDEIHDENKNVVGTISMANAGPNTNGSQFFINTADNNGLNTKHTVFGKVIDGLDVILEIEKVATEGPDRPVQDVMIESMTF